MAGSLFFLIRACVLCVINSLQEIRGNNGCPPLFPLFVVMVSSSEYTVSCFSDVMFPCIANGSRLSHLQDNGIIASGNKLRTVPLCVYWIEPNSAGLQKNVAKKLHIKTLNLCGPRVWMPLLAVRSCHSKTALRRCQQCSLTDYYKSFYFDPQKDVLKWHKVLILNPVRMSLTRFYHRFMPVRVGINPQIVLSMAAWHFNLK